MKLFRFCRYERIFDRLSHKQKNQNRKKMIQIRKQLAEGYAVACYPWEDSEDAFIIESVCPVRGHLVANDSVVLDNLATLAVAPGAFGFLTEETQPETPVEESNGWFDMDNLEEEYY